MVFPCLGETASQQKRRKFEEFPKRIALAQWHIARQPDPDYALNFIVA